jgi:hypothetical protein
VWLEFGIAATYTVPDKRGLGLQACPMTWKKYEEGIE